MIDFHEAEERFESATQLQLWFAGLCDERVADLGRGCVLLLPAHVNPSRYSGAFILQRNACMSNRHPSDRLGRVYFNTKNLIVQNQSKISSEEACLLKDSPWVQTNDKPIRHPARAGAVRIDLTHPRV